MSHEEFLQGVVNLLSARPDSAVIVLVHKGQSFEMLTNANEDRIKMRGMLEEGIDTLRNMGRMPTAEDIAEAQEYARNTVELIKKPEGLKN